MCRAFEETRKEGIAIGLAQGLEQGEEKERIKNIKQLMKTLILTAKQAMDALMIPPIEQAKYMEKLN